jgi:hypothetical protein
MTRQRSSRIMGIDRPKELRMPNFGVDRILRRISGRGALENVEQVLDDRASVAAELEALAERVMPPSPATSDASAA